ncbi:metal ABC transporter substrate-binding protein [Hyphococcus sp.]|uniref:metal ABC transporter substrate-binding protein n=1 Tax=Hyphococcus sp. TaxID=2038636 RepID=UPI0020850513|nr:MAG: zinc ABC transporter substrate-binding protein [Marinicaulis sp.]
MRNLISIAAALIIAGAQSAEAKIKIFACEPEWAALSQELGGDNVDIYTATVGTQDPHQVQARPSLIAKARAADLAVCTGAELELAWMPLIVKQSSNNQIQPGAAGYFEATRYIQLVDVPVTLDRSQGDIHAYGNPHIQTDPRNVLVVAKPLADKFAELDPSNAETYAARYTDFASRFQSAIAKWETKAAPLRGKPIAVQHRSWTYMENWLGLNEVIPLEPKPGIPPSSGYLAQVVDTLQKQPVEMIIRSAYEDPRSSNFVAKRVNVTPVMLPFTIGGTKEATDLFTLYDTTIDLMLEALNQ